MNDSYTKYPRGSEWRKWDLHFHTPSSYDYKDKSISNEDVIDELAKNEVALVAITDHHVIDVERIRALQELGKDQSVTVLPGIEFLAESRGSDPIHFIAIFPDSEEYDLEFTWSQIQAMTNIKKIRSENKAPNQVYCKIEETCNLIHELGDVVTIHAGSKTNTIDNITHSLPHGAAQKQDIADCIDIFELGKIEDIEPYKNIICKHLKRDIPLFIASDNHNIKDYKVKVNCWVKSDPTFEGLKQVLFEPNERVKNQMEHPDPKPGYRVIDRIERYSEDRVPIQSIPLNPNLNCVIGGRSTGKSVFAASIAERMQTEESDLGIQNEKYREFIESESEKIKVIWKGDSDEERREVEYYKQSFMYDVARDDKRRNQLIKAILEQAGKSSLIDSYEQKVADISKSITALIENLFTQKSRLSDLRTRSLELGDIKGIEAEIEKLKSELGSISDGTLSEEENSEFEKLEAEIQKNERKITSISEDNKSLEGLKSYKFFFHDLENKISFIPRSEIVEDLNTTLSSISDNAHNTWKTKIASIIAEQNQSINNLKKRNEEIAKLPTFIKAKQVFSQNSQSRNLQERIRNQEKTLGQIRDLAGGLKKTSTDIETTQKEVLKKYGEYTSTIDECCKSIELEKDNLKILTQAKLERGDLKKSLETTMNQQSGLAQSLVSKTASITKEELPKLISEVLDCISERRFSLKQSFDEKRALTHILAKSPYSLHYNLDYEGDSYEEMSDGKKSFVILKLLLEFSNRDCPIILDQPEDDLDNRSIYTDLVAYLKHKKIDRQIIAVTHNANIVVGADSEQIIIANQHSNQTPNKSEQKFEYISGSIEHSFIKNCEIPYTLLKQGTREHVCEILEGGNDAFRNREKKYNLNP